MADREKVIADLSTALVQMHGCGRYTSRDVDELETAAWVALKLLKEQEPRVLTLDEAAAAQEVWVEAWLSVPKKYVIMVTILYPTDDCKNFELEMLGIDKKAFMLAEAYGHTWRCWNVKPTEEQRKVTKWE